MSNKSSIEREIMEREGEDFKIVSKVDRKSGLDVEEGRYRILGGVTLGQIFTRPAKQGGKEVAGSNFAKLSGFKVAEYKVDDETGLLARDEEGNPIIVDTKIITKKEGIYLASRYGMQNAYIDSRQRGKKDKESDEELYSKLAIYLTPFPRTEAFFTDERAITAYQLNSQGKVEKPVVLLLKEEECSTKFWRLLQQDYTKKKQQREKNLRMEAKSNYNKGMEGLDKAIINEVLGMENPFE